MYQMWVGRRQVQRLQWHCFSEWLTQPSSRRAHPRPSRPFVSRLKYLVMYNLYQIIDVFI